jgi:hypothetical protein
MKRPRGTSGLTLGALVVGGVGLVLLLAGVLVFVGFTRSADGDRARIEALAPLDAAALQRLGPGHEVLLEGRLSGSQALLFRDFVAFERLQREQVASGPQKSWSGRERRTPALRVDVDGGSAWIRDSYALKPKYLWDDPRVVMRIETRYVGLVAGEPVLVVGRTVPRGPAEGAPAGSAAGLEIAADFVASGDRATYLAGVASGRTVARWLGGGLVTVGGLLVLLGAGLHLLGRRS